MPYSNADEVYSSPQINIPPTFPFILKQYAKAAIRTQPYDLLRWSASYFRALAKGEEPPIKDRLEYPPPDTPSGLSPGYLKVLIKQIGKRGTVTVNQLMERWSGICLAEEPLKEMLAVGRFGETLDWLHFVAVAAGFLSNNLTQTMVLLCNLLTDEPDGGSALIPLQMFTKLYTFLASLDCGDPDDYDDANEHEYILSEDDASISLPVSACSAPLIRERLRSCSTDPSIYEVNLESQSTYQLFMEKFNSFPSPQISPQCTPPNERETGSSSTLTPQNLCCILQDNEKIHDADEDAHLETYYDANLKNSQHSSHVSVAEEINSGMTETHGKLPDCSSKNKDIIKESQIKSSVSVPNAAYASSKCTSSPSRSANGRGDVKEKVSPSKLPSHESSGRDKRHTKNKFSHRRHIPGIGPIVDSVQVQAVMDYLEGIGLQQEGMVKPSNIRHFLCPPFEKVPASQKTRV